MRVFPPSPRGRERLLYFPFRVYVVLAMLAVELVHGQMPRHGDFGVGLLLVACGYVLCLLVFVLSAIIHVVTRHYEAALLDCFFVLLTVVFGYHSLRYLAIA